MKSVPFSVRLSHEDATYIAALEVNGATTPSDKIRHIITEARLRQNKPHEYNQSMKSIENDLRPVIEALRDKERENDSYSELLNYFTNWLCSTQATLIAEGLSEASPKEIEAKIAQKISQLTEHALRLAITKQAPCHNEHIMRDTTARIVELAQIIHTAQQQETPNA